VPVVTRLEESLILIESPLFVIKQIFGALTKKLKIGIKVEKISVQKSRGLVKREDRIL
jgi:hypothetical protein